VATADKCSLEAEPRAQLNLTRASAKVRPQRLRSGVAEDGCVGQKIVGLSELHAVEEIVEFKTHVEFPTCLPRTTSKLLMPGPRK